MSYLDISTNTTNTGVLLQDPEHLHRAGRIQNGV